MDLLHEILHGAHAQRLAPLVAARQDDAIAQILGEGRTRVASREITAMTVLAELGPDAGADVLRKLEAAAPMIPALGYAMRFLFERTLDIGDPHTQAMLDRLASAGVLSAEEAAALKALAIVPDPISTTQVSDVLNEAQAEVNRHA